MGLFHFLNFILFIMKNQQLFQIAEVKLTYKTKVKASARPKIKCSQDAFNLFKENWNLETIEFLEEFKLLLMNRSNSVLGLLAVSQGGISATVTDVRVIFQAAIKSNASGIICCHSHPSGNINPSEADNRITQKIKEAGMLLDIQLLDHIILGDESDYYSYADNGLI